VLVAIGGHIAGSRKVAATGIAILFVATALLILGAYAAYQDDSGDPRPKCDDRWAADGRCAQPAGAVRKSSRARAAVAISARSICARNGS
jgi:hypothetical protein